MQGWGPTYHLQVPPGRIQVWRRRVVTQRWFPWVARDRPGFYTLRSSGLDSGRFQSFKKVYYSIIVLGVISMVCVCVRGHACMHCVWVWAGMCEGHRTTLRSRSSPSTVGCWDQFCSIRLAQQTPFPTEPLYQSGWPFYIFIMERRSYLNPAKNTDSSVLTGTWLLSLHVLTSQPGFGFQCQPPSQNLPSPTQFNL